MFNDGTAGRNLNEATLLGGQTTRGLERDAELLPKMERVASHTGPRQKTVQPVKTELGTVTLAASHDHGSRGQRRSAERGSIGSFGKRYLSMPVAALALIYQLPARIIISMIKEGGGYVKIPWGTAVTFLGSAKSGPGQFAANALGWMLLVPTLAVTAVTGGLGVIANGIQHPIKTVQGLGRGFVKGITGFFSDKSTEMQSLWNGEGPSYYNLAAQYYTETH